MLTRSLLFLLLIGACATPFPAHAAALVSPLPLCGTAYSSHVGGFPRVLHVGTRPQGAAVSERTGHAFITLSGTNGIAGSLTCRSSVTTIDVSTGRFIRAVPVGADPPAAVVDERDGRVFVAGYREGRPATSTSLTVTALDLQGRVVKTLSPVNPCPCAGGGMGPIVLGVDAARSRFFIFTYGSVLTFDARTLRLLRSVPIDSGGAGGAPDYAVDSRQGRVFVATLQGVTVLSSSTGSVIQTLDLGESERSIVLDEATGRLFVGNGGGCRGGGAPGNVTVLNSGTGRIVRTVLSSCFGFLSMLLDAPAQRVLIRLTQPNPGIRYAVLDARDGHVVQDVNRLPSALMYTAIDARTGRIYNGAGICTDGAQPCTRVVQVVDPNRWRVVKTLNISSGWQGGLVVAAKQRRLLVVDPYTGTVTLAPAV